MQKEGNRCCYMIDLKKNFFQTFYTEHILLILIIFTIIKRNSQFIISLHLRYARNASLVKK